MHTCLIIQLDEAQAAKLVQLLKSLLVEPSNQAKPQTETRASYSPREIAKRNSYSLSFVYEEIQRGRLQATRTGGPSGHMRITPESEAAWIMAAEVGL